MINDPKSPSTIHKRGRFGAYRVLLGVPAFFLIAALGGCGWMSVTGPSATDILSGQHDPVSVNYAVVKVTPKVIEVQSRNLPRLTAFRENQRPRDITFGIGDILGVTIFEAASGGLFIPAEGGVRPGNFVTIPNQAVDIHGNISIPYAGSVRANGRTQVEVQDAIVTALKNRAIEPQVVVSLVEQKTSMISILGEGRSARIPATATPERMLDVISRAGLVATAGTATGAAGAETWVILERNGRRAIAPFGALVYESANNIYVHPNDTIYLYREPQTFLSFGAVGTQQQVPFGTWRLSLAEAISKAGGLLDVQADPASVFLYRGEARDVAEAMGIDCRPYEGPVIPVIYTINLRDPAGYFLASSFEMRNKDILYVSNAFSVESTKFMTWLTTVNTTIQGPITTATSAYGLRNIIQGAGAVPSVITAGATTVATP
ncbi:polysaccharide biosynthesis/export family protein [Bradyrhizobium erythrophlei]|uniref:Polysaccharide export outer membrane protein n=1 Tax=Bradyrhizobium erythrophlei TaxID=1437360 RepID=A0A1M7UXW7_9BRAD|nr:polysaccharide biosynthesis/export family protein [Bradyrhizobium erythrophlei]SHN87818.1 polysaccharide export outer membrane protein [Bradyrhizobium erythrophlei]